MSRVRVAAIIVLLAGLPALAAAYPISPKPLWPVTAEAEMIVVAEVEAVEALPYDEDSWVTAAAHLRVLETLKGPEKETVKVPYAANLACPAPARYTVGETVVAFLYREEDEWQTVSLSYGTLYPRGAELEAMTGLVKKAIEIQETDLEPKEMKRRKRDWLVLAAAFPGARWHGLYELQPAGDPIRSFYDRTQRPGRIELETHHIGTLADAFADAPVIDNTLVMMLGVLGNHPDPRIDQTASGVIESLLTLEEPPWWTTDLLLALLARASDADPRERWKALDCRHCDLTVGQLREIWSEAKGQLGIVDVPPADIELKEYLPVGGRTPS